MVGLHHPYPGVAVGKIPQHGARRVVGVVVDDDDLDVIAARVAQRRVQAAPDVVGIAVRQERNRHVAGIGFAEGRQDVRGRGEGSGPTARGRPGGRV